MEKEWDEAVWMESKFNHLIHDLDNFGMNNGLSLSSAGFIHFIFKNAFLLNFNEINIFLLSFLDIVIIRTIISFI